MIKFKVNHFAIGNTLSQTLCLYRHIISENIDISDIEIHYKNEINKNCIYCIPGIKREQVKPIDNSSYQNYHSSWVRMKQPPFVYLSVPDWFEPKINVENNSIVIQPREKSGFHGEDYNKWELERFVDVEPFHRLATKYADTGHQIIHCGDKNTMNFPTHKNIVELRDIESKTLLDDFHAVQNCGVVLGTESAMNVAGLCFNAKTIHSNSCHPHSDWWMGDINLNKKLLDRQTGRILTNDDILSRWGKRGIHSFYKEIKNQYDLLDNSFEELDESIAKLLNRRAL